MTHVTCMLTAKNRDQLRNPTLGNRVWATFTFLLCMGHSSQGIETQDHRSKLRVSVSKDGNAVDLTSIHDRQQFVF